MSPERAGQAWYWGNYEPPRQTPHERSEAKLIRKYGTLFRGRPPPVPSSFELRPPRL